MRMILSSPLYTWLKQKQGPPFVTPVMKANSFFYTYYKQFQHLYIDPNSSLIQYSTPKSLFLKKSLSKLNILLSKLVSVYHSNSLVLLFTKLTHMATLMINTFLKLLPIFTKFLTYLYGFLFSFMIVLNVKQTNTLLLNLI